MAEVKHLIEREDATLKVEYAIKIEGAAVTEAGYSNNTFNARPERLHITYLNGRRLGWQLRGTRIRKDGSDGSNVDLYLWSDPRFSRLEEWLNPILVETDAMARTAALDVYQRSLEVQQS